MMFLTNLRIVIVQGRKDETRFFASRDVAVDARNERVRRRSVPGWVLGMERTQAQRMARAPSPAAVGTL
jgi:hypothetical protein